MEKIKILHLSNYATNRPNGVRSVLEEIIPLQKKKINVELINLKEKKIKKIKDKDLVIFHGVYNIKYLFLWKKLKKGEIPYIIIPHCSFTKISLKQGYIKKKIFNIIAKNFYKNAELIGFLNEEERKNSIEVNNNYSYLSNGVTLPLDKTKDKIDKKISLIYLSRIDIYHKGLDILLESLKIIKDELKKDDIEVNIYGSGNKKNMNYLYEKISKYKLDKIINIKGKVEGEEKEKAFKNNEIFILTSRFEGFPISVLEALSYGLPCILSEGTNMKSIIKKYNSGWICNGDNLNISKQILEAIKMYKINRDKYIKNAIDNSKDYEWDKIISKHICIYKNIIKNKRISNDNI